MQTHVDCGVRYVDVMLQIAQIDVVKVNGIGLRISDEIAADMYNYGHFQIHFADGSLGWDEAGWGPMISDTAFFVKDVISPNGAVPIHMPDNARSDDIETHPQTSLLRLHRTDKTEQYISMSDEPEHQALCKRQDAFFARTIHDNIDLSQHMHQAIHYRFALPLIRACGSVIRLA